MIHWAWVANFMQIFSATYCLSRTKIIWLCIWDLHVFWFVPWQIKKEPEAGFTFTFLLRDGLINIKTTLHRRRGTEAGACARQVMWIYIQKGGMWSCIPLAPRRVFFSDISTQLFKWLCPFVRPSSVPSTSPPHWSSLRDDWFKYCKHTSFHPCPPPIPVRNDL